jgi:hypothetical protein
VSAPNAGFSGRSQDADRKPGYTHLYSISVFTASLPCIELSKPMKDVIQGFERVKSIRR